MGAGHISQTKIKVLSVNGTRDGVFPISKIQKSSGELPQSAIFKRVEGMNHAQFGNYGNQNGDLAAMIDDEDAMTQMTQLLLQFLFQE